MNLPASIKLTCISMALIVGMTACDNPGPAETAGKKIDQTNDDAGKSINQSADKVANKVDEQTNKVGVAVDDSEITAKIKAAYFAESGLKTLQISVETIRGVVTITGSVDTRSNSELAEKMAAAVTGVSKVNNKLALQSK